jgi:hypothetical protein
MNLSPAGLAVGEHVSVETVPGKPDAAGAIVVEPALVTGTVVAVAGDTLTVADHQGFYRPVRVSPAATLSSAGSPAALTDVALGTRVVATGFVDATHTALDATTIDLEDPQATVHPATSASNPRVMLGGDHRDEP